MRTYRLLGVGLLLALPLFAFGDDWPQWRGPNRDGVSKEKGLLKTWPETGPTLAWTFAEAGVGYSTPAIVGDRVYVLGSRDHIEYVIALDAAKGTELWTAKIGPEYAWKQNQWSEGPQAAPAVDGDLLYAVGSLGVVVCVDLKDKGKEVWRKDMPKDFGGQVNPVGGGGPQGWGYAGSPLVDGDQVIVTPGGKKGLLAALDKKKGTLLWQSKDVDEEATYSSPVVAEIGGIRQYVAMTHDGCVGVDAKTGAQLWRYERADTTEIVAPTPIAVENQVLITSWKGDLELIKLAVAGKKVTATKDYAAKTLRNEHGGVVLVDGFVYGSHLDNGWRCVDLKTGAQKWQARDLGFGSVISADGMLYCYTQEDGDVALVEASPKAFNLISKFTIPKKSVLGKRKLSGKVWTPPVIANGCLYLRDQEFLFCYKVK